MQQDERARSGSPWKRRGEVAAYLDCSVRHVDNLIASGKLPASRSGRLVFIRVDDIDRYLEASRTTAA